MTRFDRLPAIPIIANDPYFSYWMPADKLNEGETQHWSCSERPVTGLVVIDGVQYRFLSGRVGKKMQQTSLEVTPTRTKATFAAAGVELETVYTSPLLLDELDILSTPITYFDYELRSTDGKEHEIKISLKLPAEMTYEGATYREQEYIDDRIDDVTLLGTGCREQTPLNHSGDAITIDWGHVFLGAVDGKLVRITEDIVRRVGIRYENEFISGEKPYKSFCMMGFDEEYSINYFGYHAVAWFARNGKSLKQAFAEFAARHDEIIAHCDRFDAELIDEASRMGGEDYRLIVCAGYRQCIAGHKLIATADGEMAFLSKENHSNGCIGTVDVSYPSIPLFLKYAPELVNAMCRPIFTFAKCPIWIYDYAPHDVGRYPYAVGQVYASKKKFPCGVIIPDFYKMPADADVYTEKSQMPVEECGNMLIMLETAVEYGASDELITANADTLAKWVMYLDGFGEDPGDQLCTDDFAGHLAHNVNLSAKAFIGIECYSRMLARMGDEAGAAKWHDRAKELASSWLSRAVNPDGSGTYLTFEKEGWSMKYNLAWDKVLSLGLLPDDFYEKEIRSYLPRICEYGLPLDSRADYTKSDWILWTASLADDKADFEALVAPVAKYLRESRSRVAFSDWYDTSDGRFIAFIARTVQGGLYMPLIKK